MDDRISQLESLIRKYAQSYYSGESEVSDDYFDELVDELRTLNPDSEVLTKTGWGFEPEGGKKFHHLYNMTIGSLPKVKRVEDIPERFYATGVDTVRVSAKLDGLSVVSYYSAGKRVLALTRGNGTEGKDVTAKMHVISPETDTIHGCFTGAVRGEVLIDNRTWDSIKSRYNDNPSANQRNVASGIMNRNDDNNEDLRYLRYVVYKIIADESLSFDGEMSLTQMNRGSVYRSFDQVPTIGVHGTEWTQDVLVIIFNEFKREFPCDGIVITVSKVRQSDTSALIYDEIAYKFPAESKEVTVTKVTYSATRTGRMAPRVWFDPVELSGAVVRKCTGFNAEFIKTNKIGPGAVIQVCRSGEVIPHIMKVVTPAEEPFLIDKCPNCGYVLRWSGTDLVCDNESEGQLAYRFISTVGQVDGAGYSLYSKILEIFKVVDLDTLCEFLCQLRVNLSKCVDVVRSEISGTATQEKCMTIFDKIVSPVDPVTLLVACNISGLSWTSAGNLISGYPEFINDVRGLNINWSLITGIPGFGYSTVVALQAAEKRLGRILPWIIVKTPEVKEKVETQFKVAITGSLSVKRSVFDSILESHGISQSSNFKEIKYLITNKPDSGSSKMKKAKDNGVEIISESEFSKKFLED